MPMMKSPYDVLLHGTHGHTIQFKAEVPIWIPPVAESQAIGLGAREVEVDVEAKVEEGKPGSAADGKQAAPDKTEDNEAVFKVELDQAILRILARNDKADFKSDNTPKVARVIAEMDPGVRRATATEVSDAFSRLQENIDLAE